MNSVTPERVAVRTHSVLARIFLAGLLVHSLAGKAASCSNDLKAPFDIWHSGWSQDVERTRFQHPEEAGLNAKNLPRLELAWAYVFKGSRRPRSLPAVTKQAVFVGDEDGTVTALDRNSRCQYWHFKVETEVRTAITVANFETDTGHPFSHIFFMDISTNVYAVDAVTGELVWVVRAGDHAASRGTGSPVLFENQLLVPIASGEVLSALNPFYKCCTS